MLAYSVETHFLNISQAGQNARKSVPSSAIRFETLNFRFNVISILSTHG